MTCARPSAVVVLTRRFVCWPESYVLCSVVLSPGSCFVTAYSVVKACEKGFGSRAQQVPGPQFCSSAERRCADAHVRTMVSPRKGSEKSPLYNNPSWPPTPVAANCTRRTECTSSIVRYVSVCHPRADCYLRNREITCESLHGFCDTCAAHFTIVLAAPTAIYNGISDANVGLTSADGPGQFEGVTAACIFPEVARSIEMACLPCLYPQLMLPFLLPVPVPSLCAWALDSQHPSRCVHYARPVSDAVPLSAQYRDSAHHGDTCLCPVYGDLAVNRRDSPVIQTAWLNGDAFVRSFLCLQLLAFLRLVCRAIPLCARRTRYNATLRGVRRSVNGAPLAFALAFAIAFSPAAAMQHERPVHVGLSNDQVNSAVLRNWPGQVRPPANASGVMPFQVPLMGETHLIELSSPPLGGLADDTYHQHITALALQVQRRPLHCSLRIRRWGGSRALAEEIAEALELHSQGLCAVVVEPQPRSEHPVVLAVPFGVDAPVRTPVCIEIHHGHPSVTFWLDFIDQPLCLESVQQMLGCDWVAGSNVVVGLTVSPLQADEQREVQDGTLIRVFLPRRRLCAAATLSDKLCDPESHFRILETEGPPDEAIHTGAFGLLQPLVTDKIVSYAGEQNSSVFASVMLSHADEVARNLEAIRPHQISTDVELRGRPVRDLVGVFPSDIATRVPVFLDCRDIGHPVRLVAAQQGCQPLAVFLQQVGVFLEDHGSIVASGTAAFDPIQQSIAPRAKDVIRLSRRHSAAQAPDGSLCDGGCALSFPASGADRQTPTSGPASNVPPRSDAGSGGAPAPRLRSRSPPSTGRPAEATLGAANNGDCEGPFIALALCHLACDSVRLGAVQWTPNAEFRRLELEYSLAMSTLALPVIVYDADDAPARDYFVDREPLQDAVANPPQGDDDLQSDSDEPVPAMNCVAIAVFVFQRPVRWTSAWVHLGEPFDSFLARVDILHNPAAHEFCLIPVVPHPAVPYFAFLFVPRWWEAASIVPTLWCAQPRDREPSSVFLHTASHDETFADVLPSVLLQAAPTVSLFVPPTDVADAVPISPASSVAEVLHPGSPLAVIALGGPPPSFQDAVEHLRALPHSTAHWEAPSGTHGPPYCAVLLGVDFEQFLVTLQAGEILPQLAAALDLPPAHLFVHLQRDVFDELVVASHSVGVCYGFRDKRIFGAMPRGKGIFIDSRPVGRPVCYRTYLQRVLTPHELCLFLGIEVQIPLSP